MKISDKNPSAVLAPPPTRELTMTFRFDRFMSLGFILLLSLVTTSILFTQQVDVSGQLLRLQEIRNIPDPIDRDTQEIWMLSFISEELGRFKDPRTELYLDTLLVLANHSNWPSGLAFYERAKGRYYDFKGNFEKALEHYSRAIELYKPARGELKELAFAYVLKGFLLSNADLNKECWEVLEEGLPYARRAKGKNSLCFILDWFGDYYFYGLDGDKDDEMALSYYQQVQEILPQISYKRIIADNHSVLSAIYRRKGEHGKADYHYHIADSIANEANLPHVLWGLYAERGRYLEDLGLYTQANQYYMLGQKVMKNSNNVEFLSRVDKALWQNNKYLNNYKKALSYYEAHMEKELGMKTDQVATSYKELELQYDISKKEGELLKLSQNNLQIQRNLVACILLLLCLGLVAYVWKNRQLAASYRLLTESKKHVEEALVLGEQKERKRLSADLHDSVNAKLAAARWRLESITDGLSPQNENIITGTLQVIDEAYEDIRAISHNLVPSTLESNGLIAAIQQNVDKISEDGRVQIQFNAANEASEQLESIAYPIYNVVSELIANVVTHAQASFIKIQLKESQDQLYIIVEDNGQGLQTDHRDGFGLKSIRSRILAMQGSLVMETSELGGLKSTIQAPL